MNPIVEAEPPRVDRHGHVDVRVGVGVHADDHLPRVRLDSPVVRHRVASSSAGASAIKRSSPIRAVIGPS